MAIGLQSPQTTQPVGLDDTGDIFGMVPEMEENAAVCSSGFGYVSPSGTHGPGDNLTLIQSGTENGGRLVVGGSVVK
jgi:hypothetical protein